MRLRLAASYRYRPSEVVASTSLPPCSEVWAVIAPNPHCATCWSCAALAASITGRLANRGETVGVGLGTRVAVGTEVAVGGRVGVAVSAGSGVALGREVLVAVGITAVGVGVGAELHPARLKTRQLQARRNPVVLCFIVGSNGNGWI